jgi:nitrite reductase/ring-hydroxylating ferredoxin subunit
MLMDAPNKEFALAGSLEELKAKRRLVVHGGYRPILVIYDRGRVFALDNRCPHMGFPLARGESPCEETRSPAPLLAAHARRATKPPRCR